MSKLTLISKKKYEEIVPRKTQDFIYEIRKFINNEKQYEMYLQTYGIINKKKKLKIKEQILFYYILDLLGSYDSILSINDFELYQDKTQKESDYINKYEMIFGYDYRKKEDNLILTPYDVFLEYIDEIGYEKCKKYYSQITNNPFDKSFDRLIELIKMQTYEEHKNIERVLYKKYFEGIKDEVKNYYLKVSSIYEFMKKDKVKIPMCREHIHELEKVLSLLLGVFLCPLPTDNIINLIDQFNQICVTKRMLVSQIGGLNEADLTCNYNIPILVANFKIENKPTVQEVLKGLLDEHSDISIGIRELFEDEKIDYDKFKAIIQNKKLTEPLEEQKNKEDKEELKEKIIEQLKKNGMYKFFIKVSNVYNFIICNMEKLEYVIGKKDAKELSIILTYLMEPKYKFKYLTYENVLKKIGINDIEIDNTIDTEQLLHFEEYVDVTKEKVLQILFRRTYKDSCYILSKLINEKEYEEDLYILINGKPREKELTKEEKLEQFQSELILPLNTDEISFLLAYGDMIQKHSNTVVEETKKVTVNSPDLSVIDNMLKHIYIPVKSKTMFKSNKKVDEKLLKQTKETIDREISCLNEEILSYDYISRYIEVLLEKIDYYQKNIKDEIIKKEKNFNDSLKEKTVIQVLKQKENGLEKVKAVMNLQLLETYQKLLNNFMNLDLLNISRIMMSLINNNSDKTYKDITSLVKITHNILNQNVDETVYLLSQTNIPNEIKEQVQLSINNYNESLQKKENNRKGYKL